MTIGIFITLAKIYLSTMMRTDLAIKSWMKFLLHISISLGILLFTTSSQTYSTINDKIQ
ncbi:unnamed protein product [Musa acuminata subsp. burmannicoides]